LKKQKTFNDIQKLSTGQSKGEDRQMIILSEQKMKKFVDKFVEEVNIIDSFFIKKYKQYVDELT
jgi:hypothetical protein